MANVCISDRNIRPKCFWKTKRWKELMNCQHWNCPSPYLFNIKDIAIYTFPWHSTCLIVSAHPHVHAFISMKRTWGCIPAVKKKKKKQPSPVRSSERRRPARTPGSDRRRSEWCSAASCRSPETSPRISRTSGTCTHTGRTRLRPTLQNITSVCRVNTLLN